MSLCGPGLRFLLFLALLPACSKGPDAPAPGAAAGQVTISLGVANDPVLFAPVVRRFEEDHPGIRVEVRSYPAFGGQATYEYKVRSDLLAGKGPDVFILPDKEAPNFAHQGLLLDLTALADGQGGIDRADFYPQTLQAWTYEGGLAGLPHQWAVGVLIVNADLFEKEGIALDDDWDWDAFAAAAKKLTKDTNGDGRIDRYGCRRAFPDYALIPIWASGGEVVDPTGTKARLNTPEAVRAIRWYAGLSTSGHSMIPYPEDVATTNDAVDLFATKRLAMLEGANWMVKFLEQVRDFRWEIMRFPKCPATGKRATRFSADAVSIWKDTPHPREAFMLAKAFTEPPWQRMVAQMGDFIPSRRSIAESPYFLRDDTPWDERRFLRALDDARVLPRIPEFNALRRTLKDRLEEVWIPSDLGKGAGASPEEACKRMEADLQRAIDARPKALGKSKFRE
ncbi:MAG: extracellular solute-binding protein [Planctomycetota bacterium]